MQCILIIFMLTPFSNSPLIFLHLSQLPVLSFIFMTHLVHFVLSIYLPDWDHPLNHCHHTRDHTFKENFYFPEAIDCWYLLSWGRGELMNPSLIVDILISLILWRQLLLLWVPGYSCLVKYYLTPGLWLVDLTILVSSSIPIIRWSMSLGRHRVWC